MADIKTAWGSSSALTITAASLATSSTWVFGREATAVDNSSDKNLDYLVGGKITVGTSPTAGTEIRVYIVALAEDSTYPDVFDGTDSDETWTSVGIRDASSQLLVSIAVDATTSDRTYWFGPRSVGALFGGSMPKKFTVFVTHNTGVNLNSTGGNHAIYITPVYATAA
jgi:hypothetical protein